MYPNALVAGKPSLRNLRREFLFTLFGRKTAIFVMIFVVLCKLTSFCDLIRLVRILLKLPKFALKSLVKLVRPDLLFKSVEHENILITGAADGMGRLMARRFAPLCSNLILWDRNAVSMAAAVAEIEAAHPRLRVLSYVVDLSDKEAVNFTADRTKKDLERAVDTREDNERAGLKNYVSMVINNAGIVTGKKFMNSTCDMNEMTMKVNTLAHFWIAKQFLPKMMEHNDGHMVHIASSAGMAGIAGLMDYCASKWAVVGFDESMRLELRKLGLTGIKTTCVCPYYIKTGMFTGVTSKFPLLLPLLEPEYAVDRIMQAILTEQKVLVMPSVVHLAPLVRALLPTEIMDDISVWFGLNDSMDEFMGRAGPATNGVESPTS